jgi:peroxiredoxin
MPDAGGKGAAVTDAKDVIERVMPGDPAPALKVDLVGGGTWDLADSHPEMLTVVIFYRGRFCNVCSRYLPTIQNNASEFTARGTDLVVVSADNEEQARAAKQDWRLDDIPVGYGLRPADMARWGLFMSRADPGRPMAPIFCEPGFFMVKPDRTLFYAAVNSAPFGRPEIREMLDALDFIRQREDEYPQRGGLRLERASEFF